MAGKDERSTSTDEVKYTQVFMWVVIAFAMGVLVRSLYLLSYGDGFNQSDFQLLVGGFAVPLLTFAGFLAVYLGFQAQKEQNRMLKRQHSDERFEDTFFQLVRLHNETVDAINTKVHEPRLPFDRSAPPISRRIISRKDCFFHFYEELREAYTSVENKLSTDWVIAVEESTEEVNERCGPGFKGYETDRDLEQEKKRVRQAYGIFWSDNRADLEHYFQSLLQVLNHVVERKQEDTEMYIDIVVAQLTTYELLLLAYHYLCGYAPPKMKHYITDYDVLRQMPSGALLSEEHILAIDAELSKTKPQT